MFHAQVGRNGVTFQRVQFPLRIAYSLTINKSQGQTLTRIGLDLRSDVFAHGQLYVALSRAQNRHSVMCLISPSHVLNGIPHAANVVYDPFVEAATGIVRQIPPLPPFLPPSSFHPPSLPPTPSWSICHEIGDGSCGFRALARALLGDANLHSQIRQEIVQYLDANRHIHTFQAAITSGIGIENLPILGEPPCLYQSYDHYLELMSNPATYMGHPEIIAAQLKYGRTVHVSFAGSPLPIVPIAYTDIIHLLFNPISKHYDSLTITFPPSVALANPLPTGA